MLTIKAEVSDFISIPLPSAKLIMSGTIKTSAIPDLKHVISNCFISFINYNEELSKELDSLENEGTIRKM